MLLNLEYKNDGNDISQGQIELYCDQEGLNYLINKLEKLKQNGGHEHLMTPSWAGNELTELKQGNNNTMLNHLCIMVKPE